MMDRETRLFPPEDSKLRPVPLSRVLHSLVLPNRVLQSPREYLIEKTIAPGDLQGLSHITMEVALIYDRRSKHLMLLTGSRSSTSPHYQPWYVLFGKYAEAAKAARDHGLAQQYASTIHLHNHPPAFLFVGPVPIFEVGQNFRSRGDRSVAMEPQMEIAMIVTLAGIILHKGDYYARIAWDNAQKIQLVCDVLNGSKEWSEVQPLLSSQQNTEMDTV